MFSCFSQNTSLNVVFGGVEVHILTVHSYLATYTLHSNLYNADSEITSGEAIVRLGGNIEVKDELRDFTEWIYNMLMSEQPGSSLSFMCQLDIRVMMNPEMKRFEYFINKVEWENLNAHL